MNTKNILTLLMLTLVMMSCEKYLDITPKGKFIPKTVEDYENMLNSQTVLSYGDYFEDLITDDAFLPEGMPGNLFSKQALHGRRIYTFDKDVFDEGTNDFLWSEGYKRLFYYNSIINEVMNAKDGSEEIKKSVRAEALLMRALEHLELVTVYAKQYDSATAAIDPGIPIALVADINAQHERNTVQEVYDQIIEDLDWAVQYLPAESKVTKFRGNKAGGYAALSRVYLYVGNYKKALENADLALQNYSTLVDMNTYQVTIPGPFPYVPGAPLGWTNIPDGQKNPESIVSRHFLRPFGLGMDVCASPELSALFTNDDMRWVLYFANGWPPAPPFNYWNRYGVKIFLRGDFFNNCLSTPEVYLTKAECLARKGDLENALSVINTLREHRIIPAAYVAKTVSDFDNDGEKVLRFVLEERRRELAFTGRRLPDLKRLNKDPRFAKTIKHEAEGKEYILEPNSGNYLRQIWPAASRYHPDWILN